MQQMNVSEDMKVKVDFTAADIPASVKMFRPLVFHDGDSFCCVLGPDPQLGIFGCGDSVESAMKDWDDHLREQITHDKRSEVSKFVIDTMETSVEKVW